MVPSRHPQGGTQRQQWQGLEGLHSKCPSCELWLDKGWKDNCTPGTCGTERARGLLEVTQLLVHQKGRPESQSPDTRITPFLTLFHHVCWSLICYTLMHTHMHAHTCIPSSQPVSWLSLSSSARLLKMLPHLAALTPSLPLHCHLSSRPWLEATSLSSLHL